MGEELDDVNIVGPIGMMEWNVYALYVPWHLVTVYLAPMESGAGQDQIDALSWSGSQTGPIDTGGFVAGPNASPWDAIWQRLVYQWGAVTPQLYGGNLPDSDGTGSPYTQVDYDPIRRSWTRRPGALSAAGGGYVATRPEGQDQTTGGAVPPPGEIIGQQVQSEAITPFGETLMGPPGLVRTFSHEGVLGPNNVTGYMKSVGGWTGAFLKLFGGGTITVNDVVMNDRLSVNMATPVPGPGVVIFGVVRYALPVSEAFDFEVVTAPATETTVQKEYRLDRNSAINILIEGSRDQIQTIISTGSGNVAEILKTLLFGGDYFTEGTSNNQFASNLWGAQQESYWRTNDIEAVAKLQAHYDTPYMLKGIS